ncbi:MAG: hypothetical protein HYR91_00985 [Flavobacteriia bacterium]|nr:hypothetical protein [Flavobacteriia bacterium]
MKFFSFLLIIIFAVACKNKEQIQLENFIKQLPNDSLITINTYDGSNQVVHPDVLFRNNKLLMAITPYPFYEDSLENPCLYLSNNGLRFNEFSKNINPLVQTPKIDHNCDPDILYDNQGNLYLFYLETLRPFSNRIIRLKRNKGCSKFSKKIVLNYNLMKNEQIKLSPAITQNMSDQSYYLFFVNWDRKSYRNNIEMIKSNKIDVFSKKNTKNVNVKMPQNFTPWHLDVISSNDKYYLLINGFFGLQKNDEYGLFLVESNDLKTWRNGKIIMKDADVPDEQINYIYRSTGLITNDTLALWYSYFTHSDKAKLGFKKLALK